jgi:hypothetical protein
MPKSEKTRHEKKKVLTDKELIEKYEAGAQLVEELIGKVLSKPAPNAPVKVYKER